MFLGCHTMRSFLQWSLPCLMAPWSGRWWCTGIPWFFTAQTRSPLPTFTYCPLCCLLGESKIWLCTAVKFLSCILTSFCNSRTNEVLIWLNCIMQWICSFLEDLFIKCTKNCIYGQSDTVTTYDVMYFFSWFSIRWYREEVSKYWFDEFVPEMLELSPIWLLVVPFACFLLHSVS